MSGIADLSPVCAVLGSGSRGPFAFADSAVAIPFKQTSDVHVQRVSALGVITDLVEGVHYDLVSVVEDTTTGLYTGSILLRGDQDVLAAASGSTPAERLLAWREAAVDQTWALTFNTRFPSASFEQLQNKVVMTLQDLRARIERSPAAPYGDDPVDLGDRITRKGKVLAGDPTTGALSMMTLAAAASTDVALLQEFEFEAEADQTSFTLTGLTASAAASVLVYVGGAFQPVSTYTLTAGLEDTTLQFAEGVAEGEAVLVRVLGAHGVTDVGVSAALTPFVQQSTLLGAAEYLLNDTSTVVGNELTHYKGNAFGGTGVAHVYNLARLRVGAATLGSTDAPQSVTDIGSEYIFSLTQLSTMAAYSPIGGLAITGFTRSQDFWTAFGGNSGGVQAVTGIGANDALSGDHIVVGLFGLVFHEDGVGGTSEGSEITAASARSTVAPITPNTELGLGGIVVGLNITVGWAGYTENIGAFLHFGSSTVGRGQKGLVVAFDALDLSIGLGGGGVAAEFFTGQSQRWVDASEAHHGELHGTETGLRVIRSSSATNTALAALTLHRISTAAPAVGIGVGLDFSVETAADNYEIGASIRAVSTSVTSTAEAFQLSFYTMDAGAAAAERWRITSTGTLRPASNDGAAIGESGVGVSDIFLAAGAVINFNAGDVTLTAGSNSLTFAGATNGFTFNNPVVGLDAVRAHNGTAIPAGGTAGAGFTFSSTANFGVFFGSGAPTLSAAKGSIYLRSDGSGTNDRAYVNTSGGTTWTALVTVA